MLTFIKTDILDTLKFLNNVHSVYIYFLDYNLLGLLAKLCFITLFIKTSGARSLKLSFFILSLIQTYSILLHCFSELEPGFITDFIGRVPSLKLLLIADIQAILLELLCLFTNLQEITEDEDSDLEDEFCYYEETLDFVSTFKTYWVYTLTSQDFEALEHDRLPV